MKKTTAQALLKTSLLGAALAMSLWGSGISSVAAQIVVSSAASATGNIETGGDYSSYGDLFASTMSNPKPNSRYYSFGLVDFNITGVTPGANITQLSFTLYEDNYAATSPGPVDLYLSSNNADVLDKTALHYQSGGGIGTGIGGQEGIDSQLGSLYYLGQVSYSDSGMDTYTFDITDPDTQAYLNELLASGNGSLRLIIGAGGANICDTWGGIGDSYVPSPPTLDLTFEEIPEPSTDALLGLGVAALIFISRRNNKKSSSL